MLGVRNTVMKKDRENEIYLDNKLFLMCVRETRGMGGEFQKGVR